MFSIFESYASVISKKCNLEQKVLRKKANNIEDYRMLVHIIGRHTLRDGCTGYFSVPVQRYVLDIRYRYFERAGTKQG